MLLIFSEIISNIDTNGNNYNLITWDGTHWTIIPYDLDLTLWLNPWDNNGVYTVELSRKQFDVNHDIWATFKTVYLNEIKAIGWRYKWILLFTIGLYLFDTLLSILVLKKE